MTWTELAPADVATWDRDLLQFGDASFYQTTRWGKYKSGRGWAPRYFRAESNGTVVGMLQALVRMYPFGAVVAWCPGGPVGDLASSAPDSMKQLARLLRARFLYCRASFLRPATTGEAALLRRHGWRRPAASAGANMTAIWHLEHTAEDLLAGLNRDWRTRLRQAQKAGLRIERFDRPPVAEMAAMSDAMNTAKGVASAAVRESDVAAMFAALGETAVVYGCRDDSGTLLSFRSCAIHGSRAWDLMAATSADGRRLGASFAVLWELVLHCQRMGVTHYDLAGTDEAGAPGVASFKLRTGAEPLEWLSEWEWSTSPALRYAVGTLVRRRQAPSLP